MLRGRDLRRGRAPGAAPAPGGTRRARAPAPSRSRARPASRARPGARRATAPALTCGIARTGRRDRRRPSGGRARPAREARRRRPRAGCGSRGHGTRHGTSTSAPRTSPAQPVERLVRLARAGTSRPACAPARAARARGTPRRRARQVRDGAEHALAPEQLVRERRDVAHVDAGADDGRRPSRRRASAAGRARRPARR